MSDQYVKLEEQRRHRQRLEKDKKRKKKEKGKRRHSSLPTESDEDIAPAQRVDIVTEEMPEVSPCPPCHTALHDGHGFTPVCELAAMALTLGSWHMGGVGMTVQAVL